MIVCSVTELPFLYQPDGPYVHTFVDWDAPSIATNWGWSPAEVNRCILCHGDNVQCDRPDIGLWRCDDCEVQYAPCEHRDTDGTITCPRCGLKSEAFISHALAWLSDHGDEPVPDPGYFS